MISYHFQSLTFRNVTSVKIDKITRQEYKERYLYIFKMMDKAGSSNRSSSRAHSHSHRLIQLNKSEVSITVILVR